MTKGMEDGKKQALTGLAGILGDKVLKNDFGVGCGYIGPIPGLRYDAVGEWDASGRPLRATQKAELEATNRMGITEERMDRLRESYVSVVQGGLTHEETAAMRVNIANAHKKHPRLHEARVYNTQVLGGLVSVDALSTTHDSRRLYAVASEQKALKNSPTLAESYT